ncbi:hypothetical protein CL654_03045 [bacterium]|nr:hypothetical protein [bacterium]|tara:strand:+ start:9445 stop:10209 length:765 start_codon:yes stop_codon:yes gene_type:complete
MELVFAFLVALGINLVMFVPAFIFKTDKLTDLSYGLSFLIVAWILYAQSDMGLGKVILLFMISLWAIRLSTYLFIRIRKIKKDKRFDGMRESFVRFLKFWVLQGVSVWMVLLPSILYFSSKDAELVTLSFVGIVLWGVGLLIETIADYQKYSFINKEENKRKWIESGLWKYSRHPNYFGEILHWVGIFVFTYPALMGIDVLIGTVGPLYIALLIIFVSGIPLLEKQADARWGNDSNYQNYKKKTSVLVLLPRLQ